MKQPIKLPIRLSRGGIQGYLKDADDQTLADARYVASTPEAREYIVRAVNCHAELLEALKFYVSICGNTAYQVSRETAQEMYAQAQAALAKAEAQ